jgi:Putative peptidoglycan binding domain
MKKFTSLLIGCSLALAGAVAFAQQPEESPSKKNQGAEKTQAAGAKPGAKAAKPEATAKQAGAMKEPGATTEQGAGKGRKAKATEKSATATGTETGVSAQPSGGTTTETGTGKGRKARATEKSATSAGTGTDVSTQATASATPGGKHQAGQRGEKGMKGAGANANAKTSATPVTAASASAAPSVAASASAAPSVAATGQQSTGAAAAAGTKKADPQKVQQVKQQAQQIKQQHVNFRAQARPDKVPAVTFSQGYRIQGSESWQGPQYEVYRSYHPERHDRGWYSSHYTRVELIGGGYYYWNNGYWYPAWGYDPSAEYYAYDAPIYVGHRAEPPDRVIADVQAALQQMGYYQGEVDGLLGPLTRQALADYQADQGLVATAVIDEPTLDSLGMS